MHRFNPHAAVAICLTAIGLSAAPAFGAPAVPDHVDLPSVPSATQSAPAVSAPPPVPPVETPDVELPAAPRVETPEVDLPAVPAVEAPEVDLPAGSTTSAVTDSVERTVEAATGADVGATVERVVSTGEPVAGLTQTVDETVGSVNETVGSVMNVRPVVDRVERTASPAGDRGAAVDVAPTGTTSPVAPGPALISPSPSVETPGGASTDAPTGLLAGPARVDGGTAIARATAPTATDASAMPLLNTALYYSAAVASDSRAAAQPSPAAPPTGAYAAGASAAAGSSAPPSAPALPIALALVALLTLFAFKEAPAFLRPAPFVALLERPG